jgi:hypothetical protein
MKKTLGLVVLLALAASASATLRVFVTTSSAGYGLDIPANAFQPTFSTVNADGDNFNAYDYSDYYGDPHGSALGTDPTKRFHMAAFPPADAPSGTPANPVLINPGDWAYIWMQFQNEPKGANVNGLTIEIRVDGGGIVPHNATHEFAYYVMNNRNATGSYPADVSVKRWDGTATPPGYPEWNNNPQTMVSPSASGITNGAASVPVNLYQGSSRIALLGAFQAPADNVTYDVAFTNYSYSFGVTPAVAGGVFRFVPEPAGLLLVSLAGLLIRRR